MASECRPNLEREGTSPKALSLEGLVLRCGLPQTCSDTVYLGPIHYFVLNVSKEQDLSPLYGCLNAILKAPDYSSSVLSFITPSTCRPTIAAPRSTKKENIEIAVTV